ncbi:toxin-antitoxin system YwqK family antitoxin [Chondrinema litorale]|uniref:toxin-antitoxin system YwqK family antitoxin n=1 Tax=Chondrinema litorale TaxID=2994555 RepID=UPI00254347F6|nr:hypothetical protein [Chondrinema litorale]UZR99902.1 hypothetical protein OQ292_39035 [Chondrinema litorale]
MKNLIKIGSILSVIVILIFIYFQVFLQKEYEVYYNENGTLIYKVSLENGLRNGEFVQYDNDGNLQLINNWIDGKRNGYYTSYFKNGKVEKKGFFKDDSLSSEYTFFDSLGNKIEKGNYLDGKLHGDMFGYYPNGHIKTQAFFKNGLLEGKVITYYPNGKMHKYKYYHKDSLMYLKGFKEDVDDLYLCKLPIKVTEINGQDSTKKTFQIKLLHSMLNDYGIAVELEQENSPPLILLSDSSSVILEESPKAGINVIKGKLKGN